MAASVATPLEQQFAAIPGLAQMTSTSGLGIDLDHAAVRPCAQHRRRGGGRADRDQRGERIAAEGPADAADLQEDQSGRPRDPDLCRQLRRDADPGRRRVRLQRAGRIAVARDRRVAGQHRRPADPGDARAGQPDRAGRARHQPGRGAHRRWSTPRPICPRATSRASTRNTRSTPTISCSMPTPSATSSSPIATARRCRSRMSARSINSSQSARTGAWYNGKRIELLLIEREPGANTIQVVEPDQGDDAAAGGLDPALGACRPDVGPLDQHPRLGRRRRDDPDRSPSPWWCWRSSCSCARSGRRSSPA